MVTMEDESFICEIRAEVEEKVGHRACNTTATETADGRCRGVARAYYADGRMTSRGL
jgi:hypothetical protein